MNLETVMSEVKFNEVLLPMPEYPEEWECCGSECGDACVYEIYQRDKQVYDAQQKRYQEWSATVNTQNADK